MAKSMSFNQAAGLQGMLKSGHKHFEGVEGAVLRNIEAAKQLSTIVQTSMGPNGMNKLVVNHLEKIIVTSDCATIVRELEIMHPAAKMLVQAAESQEKECGDGTNFVVSFAGELLKNAAALIRQGVHTSEIVAGYKRAMEHAISTLSKLGCHAIDDFRNKDQLAYALQSVLGTKQGGYKKILASCVAEAALMVLPPPNRKPSINIDSVRVCKVLGGNVSDSCVVRGMVFDRDSEGTIKRCTNAKVAVFACGIEASATEAKGTVLIRNAEDMLSYNRSEEKKMEEVVRSIADAGVTVVVSGGSISEMALHYLERYSIMTIKVVSKWELRRLCMSTQSTAMVRLGAPTIDELGFCHLVEVREISGRKLTVFDQSPDVKEADGSAASGDGSEASDSRVATIVLRASTNSVLQDLERAVDDGINCAKALAKAFSKGGPTGTGSDQFVPGAGAAEMCLSMAVADLGASVSGLDQYAIQKYGQAFEVVPRMLAATSGHDVTDTMAKLIATHTAAARAKTGEVCRIGVVPEPGGGIGDMTAPPNGVFDLMSNKENAIRLATDAALTVLRVDQIIMSKPAGGPKPPGM